MHHAGLLPIVKEVVEMLFCRGVIKVNLLFLLDCFSVCQCCIISYLVFQTNAVGSSLDLKRLTKNNNVKKSTVLD